MCYDPGRHNYKTIHTSNLGYAGNLELGIKEALGEYIIVLDDDDGWEKTFLSVNVDALNKKRTDAVLNNFKIITEHFVNGILTVIGSRFPYHDPYLLNWLEAEKPYPSHSFIFRKELYSKFNGLNKELGFWSYWDFMLRVIASGKVSFIKTVRVFKYIRNCKYNGNFKNYSIIEPVKTVVPSLRTNAANSASASLFSNLVAYKRIPEFILNSKFKGRKQQLLLKIYSKIQRRGILVLLQIERNLKVRMVLFKDWARKLIPDKRHCDLDKLTQNLDKYEVISFDIFDTLLNRTTIDPGFSLQLLENHLQEKYENNLIPFAELRIKAENLARHDQVSQAGTDTASEDVTLRQIYTRFCSVLNLDESEIEELMQAEMHIQRSICFPNPHILEFYEKCLKADKRIIYTSDMYLPNEFIKQLLTDNGYVDFPLYLSNSIGLTKHSGNLFEYVLEKEQINADQLFHLGDNHYADFSIPRSKGIHAGYLPPFHGSDSCYLNSTGRFTQKIQNSFEAAMLGTVIKGIKKNPYSTPDEKALWRIGYELVGPNHMSYLIFILNAAISQGLSKIHFLARDGYYLSQIYDLLQAMIQVQLRGEYMYASRHLYKFPTLSKIDDSKLYELATPYQNLKVKDLLLRIGFDPEAYKSKLKKFGFDDLEEQLHVIQLTGRVLDSSKQEALTRFFASISPEIEVEAAKAGELLQQYFLERRVDNKSAIVDIGWQGSATRGISETLTKYNRTVPASYYFGTWVDAGELINSGLDVQSFYFHLGMPNYRALDIMPSIAIFELFFTAPHPTIVKLNKTNSEWQAVYEEEKLSDDEIRIKKIIFEGSMQFIRDLLKIPHLKLEHSIDYIQVVNHEYLVKTPSNIAAILGKFRHKVSYGSITSLIPIAREPDYSLKGRQWRKHKKELLKESLWHPGTRSMLRSRSSD